MKEFYVYIHRRLSDGAIFYVGKGSAKRAWYFLDRSEWWHRVYDKHGVAVEICQNAMFEDDAYLLEMWLIAKFKHDGIELVNMTCGGDAPPVFCDEDHPKYDNTIYELENIKTGKKFSGTQREFTKIYEGAQGNVSMFLAGKFKSLKGWIKSGHNPLDIGHLGKNHPSYDDKIYNFENLDGLKFVGNRYDFVKKFGLPVLQINRMIRGDSGVAKGWFISERKNVLPIGNVGKNNNNYDPTIYSFQHKSGITFTGSGLDFRQKYKIAADGVFRLKTGKSKTSGGWRMIGNDNV